SGHVGLAAKAAFGTYFARHARHFAGKGAKLLDHGVERFFELQNFAAYVDGDFAREVAAGDGGGDLSDVADLAGEVRRHQVDVVGEVFPRAADVRHLCLTAEFSLGADLARDAGDLGGEGVELVHHGIDGVLEFENFALYVDGDFSGEVAAGHGGG